MLSLWKSLSRRNRRVSAALAVVAAVSAIVAVTVPTWVVSVAVAAAMLSMSCSLVLIIVLGESPVVERGDDEPDDDGWGHGGNDPRPPESPGPQDGIDWERFEADVAAYADRQRELAAV